VTNAIDLDDCDASRTIGTGNGSGRSINSHTWTGNEGLLETERVRRARGQFGPKIRVVSLE
jgi:hypothetical protein